MKTKINKANPMDGIPGKIFKGNQDMFTNILQSSSMAVSLMELLLQNLR